MYLLSNFKVLLLCHFVFDLCKKKYTTCPKFLGNLTDRPIDIYILFYQLSCGPVVAAKNVCNIVKLLEFLCKSSSSHWPAGGASPHWHTCAGADASTLPPIPHWRLSLMQPMQGHTLFPINFSNYYEINTKENLWLET